MRRTGQGVMKPWLSIGGIAIVAVALAVTQGLTGTTKRAQKKTDSKSNEQKTQDLLNDKTYSFEDLLAGKPGAVANAERIFTLTSDSNTKQKAASILLSIGVHNPTYFDYLTQEAQKALSTDMPWPLLYDQEGRTIPKAMNPAFLDWCKNRNLNAVEVFEDAYYKAPVPWYYLAAAGDPRAHDLLVKGLHSSNYMIVVWSAEGLTKLQDPRAIDELIAAYHRSPVETRFDIAKDLVYFSDPKAQAAAEEFIQDKKLLAALREKARAQGVKALFGY